MPKLWMGGVGTLCAIATIYAKNLTTIIYAKTNKLLAYVTVTCLFEHPRRFPAHGHH